MSWRLLALIAVTLLIGFGTHALSAAFEPLTRAEAVALLVEAREETRQRLGWYKTHMPPMPLFKDAPQERWYAPYLETAFEANLMSGNPDATFRPSSLLTMEEAVTLVTRLRTAQDPSPPVVLLAPGAVKGAWFAVPLAEAASYGMQLPFAMKIGKPIERTQYLSLLTLAGIAHPEQIALSIDPSQGYLPASVTQPIPSNIVVPASISQPRPAYVAPRPQAPRIPPSYVAPKPPIRVVQQPKPQPPAPTPPKPAPSKRFAISLPSLGIKDLTISHPQDPFTHNGLLVPLKYGVGHLFAYPGKDGKILVYGHSSGYPWDVSPYTKIFRQINKLNVGDAVKITYNGDEFNYQVTFKEAVPAGDMSRYQGGGSEELILYTCWPPDSISQRYLVHAKPIGSTVDEHEEAEL